MIQTAQKWNFWTGDGVAACDRVVEKPQMVLSVLVYELAATEEFWACVEQVRGGRDPLRIAGRYGAGKRRHTIAQVLTIAAREGPRDQSYRDYLERIAADPELAADARSELRVAAARADRECAVQRLLRRAVHYPSESATSRGTYRYRDDFLLLMRAGARLIALRGARSCLVCEHRLAGAARGKRRSVRRDYCDLHEPRTPLDQAQHEWRRHAIAKVCESAAAALPGLLSG